MKEAAVITPLTFLPALQELLAVVKAQVSLTALLLIVERAPLALWMKDYTDPAQPSMVYLNQRCCELYAIAAEDWMGKADEDVFPEFAALWRTSDLAALTNDGPIFFTQTKTQANDTYRHVYKWRMAHDKQTFIVGMTVPEAHSNDHFNRGP